MAILKKKFLTPFGIDSAEDSIFRKALQVLGDLTFGTAGRLFFPEGSGAEGATNQVRINSSIEEMEMFRAGRWVPVATSAMRYDSANTRFLGNTGTGEVPMPHVASDNYLKNVPLYQANQRGSATAPAYAFSQDANTGVYSPGDNQWAVAVDGDQRVYVDTSRFSISFSGVNSFDIQAAQVVANKALHAKETFRAYKAAQFDEVITAKKQVTVENGGIVVQGNQDVNIQGTGKLIAGGNVVAYSDKRIKCEIETIDNASERCKNVRGVYYRNMLTQQYEFGVIAQELEMEFPELVESIVAQGADGTVLDDFKTVKYMNLVGVLLQAVNELNNRITELESK